MNRAEQRKDQIRLAFLNAGIELIMQKGYDAVSVADIARLADYGRSTFYLYFKDKEDLVWEMLRFQMQMLDERVIDNVQHLPTPLREWRAWQVIFYAIDLQRQFFIQMDGELSRRLRQLQKDYLNDVFTEQLRNGDYSLGLNVPPEIAARFIVGAQVEILEYWLTHPEAGDPEQIAAYFFELVFRIHPSEIPKNS